MIFSCQCLWLVAALVPHVFADFEFTSPSAGVSAATLALPVAWKESGKQPAIADLVAFQMYLCAGGNTEGSYDQLATLLQPGVFTTDSSANVSLAADLGANVPNAYFIKVVSTATGGDLINFSDRFSINPMTGLFSARVTAALKTVSGTKGPATINYITSPQNTPAVATTSSVTTESTHSSSTSASPRATTTSAPPAPALSSVAKTGIGIAVPLVLITALIALCFAFRRRRGRTDNILRDSRSYIGTQHHPTGDKPELDAGNVDPWIAGPVRIKPELSTAGARAMPPELDDTTILEADGRTRTGKRQRSNQKSLPRTNLTRSNNVSELSQPPSLFSSNITTTVVPTTSTRSTDTELIEEADVAVAELGLLAIRKKALVGQAAAIRKKPEDIEGRKGEEYRNLLERETLVRSRLVEIEAERAR